MGMRGLAYGMLLFLLVALLGGCAVNPVTGANEVAFVSEAQELALGKQNYGRYRQAQGVIMSSSPNSRATCSRSVSG